MSIHTTEELIDAFAQEMSWRRRELTELKRLVETANATAVSRAAVTRGAVALLYAHWEGVVKRLTEQYLEFVSMQRLKNKELADCMLALVLRARFRDRSEASKIATHIEVPAFFRECMDDRSRLPYKKMVRTESNLSSTVFLEILTMVGLSKKEYEGKFHLIDHSLLAKRNFIAHGQTMDVEPDEYVDLHDEITALFAQYRNALENSAVLGHYRRS